MADTEDVQAQFERIDTSKNGALDSLILCPQFLHLFMSKRSKSGAPCARNSGRWSHQGFLSAQELAAIAITHGASIKR